MFVSVVDSYKQRRLYKFASTLHYFRFYAQPAGFYTFCWFLFWFSARCMVDFHLCITSYLFNLVFFFLILFWLETNLLKLKKTISFHSEFFSWLKVNMDKFFPWSDQLESQLKIFLEYFRLLIPNRVMKFYRTNYFFF